MHADKLIKSGIMIQLTRINHKPLLLNSDLIEHMEVTPDTVISMTTGQKFMVIESAEEIVEKVIAFRRSICGSLPGCAYVDSSGVRACASQLSAAEED